MDGQNCKACSGTLPGNPVLKSIRRLVSSCLFKAFVLGILIAVQTFPVNAESGTSRESGKENGLMHLQVKGNADWV